MRRWKGVWSDPCGFSMSVSFHHCSILIHSSTTHAVKCFSPSTSVFPCQYHSTIAPYPPPSSVTVKESIAIPLLPFWSFMAGYMVTFTFTFYPQICFQITRFGRRCLTLTTYSFTVSADQNSTCTTFSVPVNRTSDVTH